MTGKYNKEYRLRVARRFCMYVILSLALTKVTASRAPRVHGTSNTAAHPLR